MSEEQLLVQSSVYHCLQRALRCVIARGISIPIRDNISPTNKDFTVCYRNSSSGCSYLREYYVNVVLLFPLDEHPTRTNKFDNFKWYVLVYTNSHVSCIYIKYRLNF